MSDLFYKPKAHFFSLLVKTEANNFSLSCLINAP